MLPLLNDLSLNTSLWDRPVAIHSSLQGTKSSMDANSGVLVMHPLALRA